MKRTTNAARVAIAKKFDAIANVVKRVAVRRRNAARITVAKTVNALRRTVVIKVRTAILVLIADAARATVANVVHALVTVFMKAKCATN